MRQEQLYLDAAGSVLALPATIGLNVGLEGLGLRSLHTLLGVGEDDNAEVAVEGLLEGVRADLTRMRASLQG